MPLCEMCNEEMSQEDYDYCDICSWFRKMVDENDYISINTDNDGNVTLIED